MQNLLNLITKYKKRTLIIAIIILTFGYVGVNQYRLSHPSQTNPQPLSTRGLPPPATDVPVTLPPDPGEAGKLTLAGIDSNNDGVRDDLEREIVYMYPQNQEVRKVLRAMVKKGQDFIATTGDHEYLKAVDLSYLAFSDCLNQILSNDLGGAHKNRDILNSVLLNTVPRYNTYRKNENLALPYVSEVGASDACEKVKGQF